MPGDRAGVEHLLSPPQTLNGAGKIRRSWYPDEPEGRCSKPERLGPGLDRETWEPGLVIGGRGRAWGGGLYGPAPPRVGLTSVTLGGHHALSCHNVPAPSRQTGTEQPGPPAVRPCVLPRRRGHLGPRPAVNMPSLTSKRVSDRPVLRTVGSPGRQVL